MKEIRRKHFASGTKLLCDCSPKDNVFPNALLGFIPFLKVIVARMYFRLTRPLCLPAEEFPPDVFLCEAVA